MSASDQICNWDYKRNERNEWRSVAYQTVTVEIVLEYEIIPGTPSSTSDPDENWPVGVWGSCSSAIRKPFKKLRPTLRSALRFYNKG